MAEKTGQRRFLGHPLGLAWLSGAEFWERFSYYGMQSLLVLYMTKQLLHPGHVEHIIGFAPFQRFLEFLHGPLSAGALASNTFGLYAGLVYVTPIAGGLIADRLTGRTHAVTAGASLMAIGHFLMAFDASFLIALMCLLLGVGLFKGNIASQVGHLYAEDDPLRADGFQIYMLGIQIAVIFAPIVCGTLAVYNWHWGFGAAGIGMVIGLAIYRAGRRAFPAEERRSKAEARPKLTPHDRRVVVFMVALLPLLAVGAIGNQQIFNAYMVWSERSYQLHILGFDMPVTYILSFGSIVSTLTMAGSVGFWHWWSTSWREPSELAKITLGMALSAAAPLFLVAAAALFAATGQRVSLGWEAGFEFANDIGFSNVFPVGLALYARVAPKGFSGVMIGVYYVHLFLCNYLVGALGGMLDDMTGVQFWLLHVGLMTAATLALFGMWRLFGKNVLGAPAPHHH